MPVRLARDADVPEIRALVRSAFRVYLDRMDRPPAPMDDDYAARVRDGAVWVAGDDAVRGIAVVVPRADHLFLETLAVRPGDQGRGVGSRLLEFTEARARTLGLPEVRLATNERMTENLRFYAARGYRETGRGVEDGYSRVFFRKRVDVGP